MSLKKKIRIREVRTPNNELGLTSEIGEDHYLVRIHPDHCSERSRMNTVVHEGLHVADFDGLSERRVRLLTAYVVECLWREGYRRVKSKPRRK
jgi:hypothetical protein